MVPLFSYFNNFANFSCTFFSLEYYTIKKRETLRFPLFSFVSQNALGERIATHVAVVSPFVGLVLATSIFTD